MNHVLVEPGHSCKSEGKLRSHGIFLMEFFPGIVALILPRVPGPLDLFLAQTVFPGIRFLILGKRESLLVTHREAVFRKSLPREKYRLHVRFPAFRGYPRSVKEILHAVCSGFPEDQSVPVLRDRLVDGKNRVFGPLPESDLAGVDIM